MRVFPVSTGFGVLVGLLVLVFGLPVLAAGPASSVPSPKPKAAAPRYQCAKACSAERQACFLRARESFRGARGACAKAQEAVQVACAAGWRLGSTECRQARKSLRNCVYARRRDFRLQLRDCVRKARACFVGECGLSAGPKPAAPAGGSPPPPRPTAAAAE